jgi:SPP1 gp7 family putative phage head morphogenesis protein
MANADNEPIREIAAQNLLAWKKAGVVKSLKYYSADDDAVCDNCKKHSGAIIEISKAEMGYNLPPITECSSSRCRCYFRPYDISLN